MLVGMLAFLQPPPTPLTSISQRRQAFVKRLDSRNAMRHHQLEAHYVPKMCLRRPMSSCKKRVGEFVRYIIGIAGSIISLFPSFDSYSDSRYYLQLYLAFSIRQRSHVVHRPSAWPLTRLSSICSCLAAVCSTQSQGPTEYRRLVSSHQTHHPSTTPG